MTRWWRGGCPAIPAVVACVLVFSTVGCERAEEETGAEHGRLQIGDPDIDYFYWSPGRGIDEAPDVSRIPVLRRGAVMVYHPEATPVAERSDRVWVADLLGLDAGDDIQARKMSRTAYLKHARNTFEAERYGRYAGMFARELCKLSDGSDRSRASERARETFNELLPRIPEKPQPDASSP